jgi:hypothetical protein
MLAKCPNLYYNKEKRTMSIKKSKKNIITISGNNGIQFPVESMEYRDNGDDKLPVIYFVIDEQEFKNNNFQRNENITIYNNGKELFTGTYSYTEYIICPHQHFRDLIIAVNNLKIYGYGMMSCCGVNQLVRKKMLYGKYIFISRPEEQEDVLPVVEEAPKFQIDKKTLKEMAAAMRGVSQSYEMKKKKDKLIAMRLFVTLYDLMILFAKLINDNFVSFYKPLIDPFPK